MKAYGGPWMGCCIKVHNEDLCNLYASPDIIRVIKSRRMRWARRIRRMGKMVNAYNFWLEYPKGRDYLEDLGVDGKTIL
jgi:hypothetical protein